jgi:hypothetical protein
MLTRRLIGVLFALLFVAVLLPARGVAYDEPGQSYRPSRRSRRHVQRRRRARPARRAAASESPSTVADDNISSWELQTPSQSIRRSRARRARRGVRTPPVNANTEVPEGSVEEPKTRSPRRQRSATIASRAVQVAPTKSANVNAGDAALTPAPAPSPSPQLRTRRRRTRHTHRRRPGA